MDKWQNNLHAIRERITIALAVTKTTNEEHDMKDLQVPLPDMIKQTLARGYSEQAMADSIGIRQNTLNRIKTGVISDPAWTVGLKIYNAYLTLPERKAA